MSAFAITIIVVSASGLAILLLVLAPWRSARSDALEPEDYYAVLAGEPPDDGGTADSDPDRGDAERDDESGPSAGDVAIP